MLHKNGYTMTEFTVQIPEGKINFFKNLIANLGFDYADTKTDKDVIPQWQQDIVLERIKNTPKDQYVSWEEIEKNITFD